MTVGVLLAGPVCCVWGEAFSRSWTAGYGGTDLCPRRWTACIGLRGAVRRTPLPSASQGGFGTGDHSGELRRGRRVCFDEQVIGIRWLGDVGWCIGFFIETRGIYDACCLPSAGYVQSASGSYMYRSRDVPDLTRRMPCFLSDISSMSAILGSPFSFGGGFFRG